MVIEALVHLLGSSEGYRTLWSSPSLSPQDTSQLEVLGFGQTDNPEYLTSLRRWPSLMGRPLPSGSFAVTRCYPGQRDSANRQTLLFASMVFSTGDWPHVALNLNWLANLHDVWENAISRRTSSLLLDLPAEPRNTRLGTLSLGLLDSWMVNKQSRPLIATDSSPTADADLLQIPSLLPPSERLQLSWGTRMLSPSMNLDICSFAPDKTFHGKRPVIGPSSELRSPYTGALQHMHRIHGIIPADFINSLSSTEVSLDTEWETSARKQKDGDRNHHLTGIPTTIALASLLAAGVAILIFLLLGRGSSQPPPSKAGAVQLPSQAEASNEIPITQSPSADKIGHAYASRGSWQKPELRRWIEIANTLDPAESNTVIQSDLLRAREFAELNESFSHWRSRIENEIRLGVPGRNDTQRFQNLRELGVAQEVEEWPIRFNEYKDFSALFRELSRDLEDVKLLLETFHGDCEVRRRELLDQASKLVHGELHRSFSRFRLPVENQEKTAMSSLNAIASAPPKSESASTDDDLLARVGPLLNYSRDLTSVLGSAQAEDLQPIEAIERSSRAAFMISAISNRLSKSPLIRLAQRALDPSTLSRLPDRIDSPARALARAGTRIADMVRELQPAPSDGAMQDRDAIPKPQSKTGILKENEKDG